MDEERKGWGIFGGLLVAIGASSAYAASGDWLPMDTVAAALLAGASVHYAFGNRVISRLTSGAMSRRDSGEMRWQRAILDDGVLTGVFLVVFAFFVAAAKNGGVSTLCAGTECLSIPTGSNASWALALVGIVLAIVSFVLTLVGADRRRKEWGQSLTLARRILEAAVGIGVYAFAVVVASRIVTHQGGTVRLIAIAVATASVLAAIQCYRELMWPDPNTHNIKPDHPEHHGASDHTPRA